MPNQDKLVSIGLPIYNMADYICECLDSLLAQSYKNFELIISDNASTDDTQKICEKYAKKDQRVKYIRQKENIGSNKNCKYLLDLAAGEYFMWAPADDQWHPDFISTLVSVLNNQPQYGLAMSSFKDGDREFVFRGRNDLSNLDDRELFLKLTTFSFSFGACIYGIFRTDLLKKAFQKTFPPCMNTETVILGEFALLACIYTSPHILWYKRKTYKNPAVKRKDPSFRGGVFGVLRYIFYLSSRIFASHHIPVGRKIGLLPTYARFLYHMRRRLLKFWKNSETLAAG